MKKVISLCAVLVIMISFAQDASAHGRHMHYRRGYYDPTPYYQPYYGAPAYRDIWVKPHWRRTPYGREFVSGHWVRQRLY